MKAPSCLVGAAVLVAGCWLLSAGPGDAADEKEANAAVARVAALIAKNDMAGAKKEAAAVREKFDVEAVMKTLSLRTKKGIGVGPVAGAIKPDGVEQFILNMDKRAPQKKDAAAAEQAAYITAAVAEIVIDNCPVKTKQKNKDPKEWKQWSDDMRKSSLELAAALKNYNTAAIKKAATDLNNSCTNCHGPFRE
jgi:hypothetical protein